MVSGLGLIELQAVASFAFGLVQGLVCLLVQLVVALAGAAYRCADAYCDGLVSGDGNLMQALEQSLAFF